ncbi:hypothetical protein ACFQ5M_01595 [Agrilactobacillus yilanensis]|uniref:Methanol dehydrogenase n=1 Tax=Agrilactobacillus yilanensis TaxID=2485997 RepID=A0ABW4J4B7_9LACO|nr:methanol dehydrogenase [Agrilactobacillus yilanensis]
MKHNLIKIGIGVTLLALGTCLIKKKGLMSDDYSAYDEFEADYQD